MEHFSINSDFIEKFSTVQCPLNLKSRCIVFWGALKTHVLHYVKEQAKRLIIMRANNYCVCFKHQENTDIFDHLLGCTSLQCYMLHNIAKQSL